MPSTAALREFDALARRLADAGIEVVVAEDSPEPAKPDACFPNNWVSFHADGSVVLYPMMAPSRRAERRREPIAAVERAGYRVARTIDLSPLEARGEFLEGTGSLVLDRPRRIAYACRSPRTTAGALAEFSAALGYRVVAFDALGPDGRPAYHTNVLMAIGEGFAVVCAESIAEAGPRAAVIEELGRDGREVIVIDAAEMNGFAGNLLALRARDGDPLIAMSEAALRALAPEKRRRIERHGSDRRRRDSDHRAARRRERALHARGGLPAAQPRLALDAGTRSQGPDRLPAGLDRRRAR